jgi:ketosteroid isomerase-like protein
MTTPDRRAWHPALVIGLDSVRDWTDRYERAWRSNDPADVGGLFTDDAVYRWKPSDSPGDGATSGRDAIVAAWLDQPDDPATWTLDCEPLAVNGSLGIARCVVRYRKTARQEAATYHTIWLVDLAEDGRCRAFTEYG